MKALTLTASSEFVFGDVPDPTAGPEDLIIEVKACGICGSDVHGMDGSTGRRIPPIVMGHEAAGVVREVGTAAGDWRPGEAVTFDSTLFCGHCRHCLLGRVNLCENRRVLGVSCAEYRQPGAFAEFVRIPGRVAVRIPGGVSFQQAVFVEPCAVALHAVRRAQARPGDSAVVVGAGIIGLLVIQALKAAGCGRVYATDLNEQRLQLALQLGADAIFPSAAGNVRESLLESTGGDGVDVAMECVGVGPTVDLAIAAVRKGGTVALVGNLAPRCEFPLQAVVTRELSVFGCCASAGEYPQALEEIASGRIRVEPLTSAVAPLKEGASWFHRLHGGKEDLIKVILEP
ncbi:MAG: galactitol-1-phosphate 5-dehydrogenase [Verrucomicrobiales bacterium]|nr:galactitol-1-phosphate 5-dehydrogenase [Verrucomicrobiales bacterium]